MWPDEFLLWASIAPIIGSWAKISQPLWINLPPILLLLAGLGVIALGAKFYPRSWVSAIAFGLGIAIALWRLI
jgi:hypothetical protein